MTKLYRTTAQGRAESFIRAHADNWMQYIDVQDNTGVSAHVVRDVVARLQYINILEVGKEGRMKKFRLRQSFIDRRDVYDRD
jgi:hypothetical protein